MRRFVLWWLISLAAGLVILAFPCLAGAEDTAAFGYTKQKTAVYAGPSAAQKTKETIKAFTVVRIVSPGQKYLGLEDGTYVLAQDVGIFRVFGAQGKVVYWPKEQTMYATGNSNHPLKTKLPANTPVSPLYTMVEYYLVYWEGVYGFIPMANAKEPPAPQNCTPVYAVLTPDVPLYDLPLAGSLSSFRLPWEQAAVIGRKAAEYYLISWEDRIYYVKEQDLPSAFAAVRPRQTQGWAESALPLWNFPDAARAEQIGFVPAGTECAIEYAVNEYVQVTRDGVTGFVLADQFLYPGGDPGRYYLFLNKAARQLTVYRADEKGKKTNEAVLTVTVAIGKMTTPTPSGLYTLGARERWHYFGPSYAPYAIAYTTGRYVHGPLYWARRESALNTARLADFGQAVTGGCVRTPYEAVQWIYYHCAAGTPLEIVNGVRPPSVPTEAAAEPAG